MSDKIDQILTKVTESELNIALIQKDVKQNTKDLTDHIKRTNLLEASMNKQDIRIEEALIPVKWLRITVKVLGPSIVIFTGLKFWLNS